MILAKDRSSSYSGQSWQGVGEGHETEPGVFKWGLFPGGGGQDLLLLLLTRAARVWWLALLIPSWYLLSGSTVL